MQAERRYIKPLLRPVLRNLMLPLHTSCRLFHLQEELGEERRRQSADTLGRLRDTSSGMLHKLVLLSPHQHVGAPAAMPDMVLQEEPGMMALSTPPGISRHHAAAAADGTRPPSVQLLEWPDVVKRAPPPEPMDSLPLESGADAQGACLRAG